MFREKPRFAHELLLRLIVPADARDQANEIRRASERTIAESQAFTSNDHANSNTGR